MTRPSSLRTSRITTLNLTESEHNTVEKLRSQGYKLKQIFLIGLETITKQLDIDKV